MAERRTNAPVCHGKPMDIRIHAVTGFMGKRDCHYKCPITGEIVRSQRQREYIMQKHDVLDAMDFQSNFDRQNREHARRKELAATLPRVTLDEKTIKKLQQQQEA